MHKRLTTPILSCFLVIVISACATPVTEIAFPTEQVTLKMNSSKLTSYGPIFIADAEGFFADEGITVEFVTFNRTADALPLIVTGDLDVYAGVVTSAGLLNVLKQEPNLKVVADRGVITPDDPCVNLGVLFNKALYESGMLTSPTDLKGRTIAVTVSGGSGFFLASYLASAGLTLEDITVSDIPPSAYQDAIANGTVDAILTTEPRLSQVLSGGKAVLVANSADYLGVWQTSAVVFGKNLLVENRDVGIRFLRAYLRGVEQYLQGKTDRNVEIMLEYTGESEDILRNACWININPNGFIDFEKGVTPFQRWSFDNGELDALLTEDEFWDPSLLEDALQK